MPFNFVKSGNYIYSGAPFPYRKAKDIRELIFLWSSWLAVLLVGEYAQNDGDDDSRILQDGGHTPAYRSTETYSLGL